MGHINHKRHKTPQSGFLWRGRGDTNDTKAFRLVSVCVPCACVLTHLAGQTYGSEIPIFWAATKASDARLSAVRLALALSEVLMPVR
jgi:hypothetical protein